MNPAHHRGGGFKGEKGLPWLCSPSIGPQKYTHTHQWTLAQIASHPSIRMGFRVELWVEDMVHVKVMKKKNRGVLGRAWSKYHMEYVFNLSSLKIYI